MMNAQSREELLSAYLDGELPADQRAQVESWLVEDATYRQLYEDLRGVRSGVQSLPRHKLDRDLSATVLRRAERAVLSGDAPSGVAPRVAPHTTLHQWWSKRSWRMIVWPAVAAAAALAIALFDVGQQPAERQVAQKAAGEVGQMGGAKRSDDGVPDAASKLAVGARDELPAAIEDTAATRGLDESESLSRPIGAPMPARAQPSAGVMLRSLNEQPAAPADSKAEQLAEPRLVVCDVAAQFIDERIFEKLLDEQKLTWEQAQSIEHPGDVPAEVEAGKSKAVGLRYVVHVSPDELKTVVSDLSARKDLVVKVEQRRREAKALKEDNYAFRSAASGEARTTRQPITFWLRPTPAEPRPRDDAR
jgi:negative regulator of sigma E activity